MACAAFVKVTVNKDKESIAQFYDETLALRDRMLQEPGVLTYDIAQSEREPNVFMIYEAFESWVIPTEVLPHRDWFSEYLQRVVPLWAEDRQVQMCRLLHSAHLPPSQTGTPFPSPPPTANGKASSPFYPRTDNTPAVDA